MALLSLLLWSALLPNIASAETSTKSFTIGDFSSGALKDWKGRSFKGETKYAIVFDREANSMVLAADSEKAASGMFRKVRIDLSRTPFLNWSWKVTRVFPSIDENIKAGDDFPARIYVAAWYAWDEQSHSTTLGQVDTGLEAFGRALSRIRSDFSPSIRARRALENGCVASETFESI